MTDRTITKNCGAIKTLMREAVNNISPKAIKEKGIQQHTVKQQWLTDLGKFTTTVQGNQVLHKEPIMETTRFTSCPSLSTEDLSQSRLSRKPNLHFLLSGTSVIQLYSENNPHQISDTDFLPGKALSPLFSWASDF